MRRGKGLQLFLSKRVFDGDRLRLQSLLLMVQSIYVGLHAIGLGLGLPGPTKD
jgi:hypothetical protein